MTSELSITQRRIIPRWRDSRIALSTGELVFPRVDLRHEVERKEQFNKKRQSWLNNQTVELAAEVVSHGLVQGFLDDSIDAAEFLIHNKEAVAPAALLVAQELLIRAGKKLPENDNHLTQETISAVNLYNRIHNQKHLLIEYPPNPLMWVDLSRAYTILGQVDKAKAAMMRAQILAPNNRFVLRSAARLFVHIDEGDRAHHLLSSRDVTKKDPWLLAAEIAVANVVGKTSKLIKSSRDILNRELFHPFHTAELASALGSLEFFNGATQKAKKLFKASLVAPTENSVAQSVWVKQWLPSLEVSNAIDKTPRTYEAHAWNSYLILDWMGIVQASSNWSLDEPFSSRPAELGSFAASVGLEDFELAEKISRNALLANPTDNILLNNLAFALANQEKIDEAFKTINKISRPASEIRAEIVLTATEGLIHLRSGNFELGQSMYLRAILHAENEGLQRMRALASIYYAREMIRMKQLSYSTGLEFAEKASVRFSDSVVLWSLNKLRESGN